MKSEQTIRSSSVNEPLESPNAGGCNHDRENSVSVYVAGTGALELTGKDTLDFLHRMSTNDVLTLKPGKTCVTVLVDDRARVIDLVTILHRGNSLMLLTSAGNAGRVRQWLDKFIISEDVQIQELTNDMSSCYLFGVKAFSLFRTWCSPSLRELQGPDDVSEFDGSFVYMSQFWNQSVHCIVSGVDAMRNLVEVMINKSTAEKEEIRILSEVEWNEMRIQEGIPILGSELSDKVNPLEVNLVKFISFTKGCYIGQEVIARIDTYKKLQKRLVGVIFDETSLELSSEPGILLRRGEEVGWTTSHCWSPGPARWIALGFLKTESEMDEIRFLCRSCSSLFSVTVRSFIT